MSEHSCTRDEILSQTDAWAEALQVARNAPLPRAADHEYVLFTGCGSTYYLCLSAAALYQELTGRTARAVPAGELLLNPQVVAPPSGTRPLLVAISRSGATTETVRAVEQFKASQAGRVIVISNHQDALALLADIAIQIPKGREESVAQTRSFASMYVAACVLCTRMAGRSDLVDSMSALPETGRRLLRNCGPIAERTGADLTFDRFYFLGSGIRYGLASEANLKMKEMTLTHSEPFHFLEFRHGPMSMVGPTAVAVGLLSEKNRAHEVAVLNDVKALGTSVLTLAESDADVVFQSGIPESVRGVLYLPALQLMALERAVAKGLNPDRPQNLTAVVRLDL
jgi:glutamine---fructose-6-phosphate transaminase (isomerizing)